MVARPTLPLMFSPRNLARLQQAAISAEQSIRGTSGLKMHTISVGQGITCNGFSGKHLTCMLNSTQLSLLHIDVTL